ncbi:DoxX family membrane protein [Streptomyces xiaopingdaonensis]|uniref:DoxX family membrane protein n=1 Tax=Streptomyces xiaopingdaonensis TaxID=1565415 RepID=UPI00052753FB|nr:DoxX family protein [Streptomyces xiaopingdaonensis]
MRVASDPAEVIVNHVSFRVQLGGESAPRSTSFADTAPLPTVSPGAVGGAVGAASGRRRAPVVWSGKTAPGEGLPTELLRAVPSAGAAPAEARPALAPVPGPQTRVLPRVNRGGTGPTPTIGSPRGPGAPESPESAPSAESPLLTGVRPARGAFDEEDPFDTGQLETVTDVRGDDQTDERRAQRQAYYPGRRMNLGVVLLPLRIFLGLISLYAGMGKLCDPVYFDGGERGSMVTWLRSLEPWAVAEPLRDFALAHPVGSGLTVAFLQVIVGVLTVLGLWQRAAAVLGALLSAALLLTVSWRTVPAYDAPDLLYLAAWSPLVIAGAPVYSLDARLSGEAWRRLGPRVPVRDLRRRVLRRGAVIATVVVGISLLAGSMLGGAVRSSQVATVPDDGETPTNQLPGSPLPQRPGAGERGDASTQGPEGGTVGAPGGARQQEPDDSAAEQKREEDRATDPEAAPEQGQESESAPQRSAPPQQQAPPQPSAGGQTTGPGTAPDSSASAGGGAQHSEPEPDSPQSGGSSPEGDDSDGGRGALGGLLGR